MVERDPLVVWLAGGAGGLSAQTLMVDSFQLTEGRTHTMPSRSPQIGLLCQIAAGGFSGERVVQIPLPDARMHKGLAPTHYCWTRAERPLAREEPAPGVLLDGIVAARWLQDAPDAK